MEHLGIIGVSFSGSTILNYVLGQSKDIIALGESHWVVDNPGVNVCTICHEDCPIWTKEIKENITRKTFYKMLNSQIKQYKPTTKYIVHSNKNYRVYKRFNSFSKIKKFIVLYKRPESFICSAIRHRKEKAPVEFSSKSRLHWIKLFSNSYISNYKTILREVNNIFYILFFEEFTTNPVQETEKLCKTLNIEYSSKFLNYKHRPCNAHTLAGNAFVNHSIKGGTEFLKKLCKRLDTDKKWYIKGEGTIRKDERWKNELTQSEIDWIQKNKNLQKIYDKLNQLRGKYDNC